MEFAAYLRENKLQFERCENDAYWKDKLYWFIKLNNEDVCYISIKDPDDKDVLWTVWSNTCDFSSWFKDFPLDENMREIAWKYVDFCANCSPGSSCYGGMHKIVFGRDFEKVCRTTFRFDNPNSEALTFMKKMVEIRKNDILNKNSIKGTHNWK